MVIIVVVAFGVRRSALGAQKRLHLAARAAKLRLSFRQTDLTGGQLAPLRRPARVISIINGRARPPPDWPGPIETIETIED